MRLSLFIENNLFCHAITRALACFRELEVLEGANLEFGRRPPDVALVCSMTSTNYLLANVARVRLTSSRTRVAALLPDEDTALSAKLRAAGVVAVDHAHITFDELIAHLRRSRAAGPPGRLNGQQVQFFRDHLHCHRTLSEREHEIVNLVAKAMSNRQIAGALRITEGTVKRHLRNIFMKLSASSRIDAVNKAVIGRCRCPEGGRSLCGDGSVNSFHSDLSDQFSGPGGWRMVTLCSGE